MGIYQLPCLTGYDSPEPWRTHFAPTNTNQLVVTDGWKMHDCNPATYGRAVKTTNADFWYSIYTTWGGVVEFSLFSYSVTIRSDTTVTAPRFWDLDLSHPDHGNDLQGQYFTEHLTWDTWWTADRQTNLNWAPGETKYIELVEVMPLSLGISFDMDYFIAKQQGWWFGDQWSEQTVDIASLIFYAVSPDLNIWAFKNGSWKPSTDIWVYKNGTWRPESTVDVTKSGAWRSI